MKKIKNVILLGFGLLFTQAACSQNMDELRDALAKLIKPFQGRIGIAMIDLATNDTVTINGHLHYTMASTYKTPLAISVLRQVDMGKLSLSQLVHVTKQDLPANTWSPLQKKYPDGNIDLSVAELLDYTVSKSDNNACDILFKLLGGTKRVDAFIHEIGYKNISIQTTEAEMHLSEKNEKANWCSPYEMAKMFAAIQQKKHLEGATSTFLIKLLIETENSPKRLKAGLPGDTKIAHKTGTGSGEPPATVNDAGIIYMPGGKAIAVSVYINACKEKFDDAEAMIAAASKTILSFYSKHPAAK